MITSKIKGWNNNLKKTSENNDEFGDILAK